MMHTVTAAWVLTMLIGTEPNAPWRDTYEATAQAMADSANEAPLFAGEDGPAKTVAYLVSVSWFESNHNPRAVGDKGTSFCLGQINQTNFAGLGITRDEVLGDVRVCVRAMNVMMRQSLKVCAALDAEQGLAWYTAGGPTCRPNQQSAHRVRKARWLFAHYRVQ